MADKIIVGFTVYEPVMRIATADIELTPEDVEAIEDGYGMTETGVESYILEVLNDWEDHARVDYDFIAGADIEYEVTL